MKIKEGEIFFLSRQGRCLKALEEGFPNMPESERVACAVQYSRRKSNPFDILVRHKRLVENTVVAYIRHRYTDYDSLLDQGVPRDIARAKVGRIVRKILNHWKGGNDAKG